MLARYLPVLAWGRRYSRDQFGRDAVAALVVTIMLIPQSLAYALLAGLPPEVGLYASILPLLAYAIFGSSTSLAVGPVAVISLMTAAAVGRLAAEGTADYASAAIVLALLSGGMLTLLGLFRLGFIANFLSHPVISGFITASGIIIATSQIGALLGIASHGHAMPDLLASLWPGLSGLNPYTIAVGFGSLAILVWVRLDMKRRLTGWGMGAGLATVLVRAAPALVVLGAIAASALFDLGDKGVALVGAVPQGIPLLAIPDLSLDLVGALIGPAFIISIVGFVESVSVAQTLAAKKRERIDPDRELIGLGAANIAAGLGSGYPVTGGFARSVVNHDAGAATPAAGILTALGIAIATLLLTPFLALLPKATLAATIVVAVLALVDFSILKKAFAYSRADFIAVATTLAVTLVFGVEMGISLGVAASILVFLYRTSRPHMAVVGRVPGSEHFRNVRRHSVETDPSILSLRVDESLYFANARYLEDVVLTAVGANPELRHVILMCPAVNAIDMSALESLEAINDRLRDMGLAFHLTEVKGPVMDKLKRSDFLANLTGEVFLSQHEAITRLSRKSPNA
ncbi:SulP family inorganic anion transporter [Pelagibacterium lacus]|uniref:STAS domain-containing protein n=1 Tax=Pelagibacterium lacus TaxID=2282655 RepID=A0A369W3W0_9HYPH|nr:sulfate permease [Pelagibacterium lacus]RDE09013.1 STAS domain-containing protein [Pelagibacterium lacus]